MKQVFILFKTGVDGVKQIKEIYLEKDKAQGEFVCKILTDNQDSDSKVVYSLEAQNVYTRPARTKKAAKSSSANGNGRTKIATTKDTVL